MNQQQHVITTNTYILKKKTQKKKYEWYEYELMTYINNLKFDNFIINMDYHFSRVKIKNFNIVNHQFRCDKLQNPQQYLETIYDKDFLNYENHVRDQAISSAIKSERDDIHSKNDFLKRHIKRDIEEDLKSNGFFIKKNRKKSD